MFYFSTSYPRGMFVFFLILRQSRMENMYQTIYEAVPDLSVAPPLVIVCVLTLCLVTYIIYAWKTGKDDYRFLIFVAVILVFIISCSFYTSIDAKRKVYDEYVHCLQQMEMFLWQFFLNLKKLYP